MQTKSKQTNSTKQTNKQTNKQTLHLATATSTLWFFAFFLALTNLSFSHANPNVNINKNLYIISENFDLILTHISLFWLRVYLCVASKVDKKLCDSGHTNKKNDEFFFSILVNFQTAISSVLQM